MASVADAAGADVDRIVVDADDATALAEMCAHTNLVISTVGPYALYGSKLVAAVTEAGIDYVDLTGDPPAPTNTRVVLRTHSLLNRTWGSAFTYGEATAMGDGISGRAKALALSGGLAGFMGAASIGPVRTLMGRFLPEPGEGPSTDKPTDGFYDLRFHGTTSAGDEIMVKVTGDMDPGYGSTSKILSEAAATLMKSDVGGGFWTPATALGDPFIHALTSHAGLTFDTVGEKIKNSSGQESPE